MIKPLDITTTPVPGGHQTHWRCPHSPQCTRGQIRTSRDVTDLLEQLEAWHQGQHRPPDLMAALRASVERARAVNGSRR